jgi:glycosyltransferase involved in cell wall biosynthesis
MKIAFIGHGYHQKTESPRFFIDLINPYCEIDFYWDNSYIGKEPIDFDAISRMNYKKIIIWQMVRCVPLTQKYPDIEWYSIPMLDDAWDVEDSIFVKNVKYISFSKILHNRLVQLGCDSHYFQFFLNPFDYQTNNCELLKGFFWERTSKITLENTITKIVDLNDFQEFNYHNCIDPGYKENNKYNIYSLKYRNFKTSEWFESKKDYIGYLKNYTVFFAPRQVEGIGFSFLEAMSMGQCVIAPNCGTMNEYIIDGFNGLLYDPEFPNKVDLTKVNGIRKNIRKYCVDGYYKWMIEKEKINQIIFDFKEDVYPYNLPAVDFINKKRILSINPGINEKNDIKVSVITPILNPSCSDLQSTLESIIYQDFTNFEYIIVDGGSSPEVDELLANYKNGIDNLIRGKDNGPYDAMLKGVQEANGEWIIFINAGDIFSTSKILSKIFVNINDSSPDIIYGDHFWLHENKAHLHRALPLNALKGFHRFEYADTALWKIGIPGHQATFTKKELLLKYPFKYQQYNIAADHDLLFHYITSGIKYMQVSFPISIYKSGGLSFCNIEKCHQEQADIYEYYKIKESEGLDPIDLYENFIQCINQETSETPSITIVSPIYNSKEKIIRTIESIINQEGNFTIYYHIQNGKSNDDTETIIFNYFSKLRLKSKCKKIIVSYENEKDTGIYHAINKAFNATIFLEDDTFIGWLNAGDIFYPHAFSFVSKISKTNNIEWFGQFPRAFDVEKQMYYEWKTPFPNGIIKDGLCDIENWPPLQQEGSFWRAFAWKKVKGIDEKLKLAGDWDLWRRLAQDFDYCIVNIPLALFYIEKSQLSSIDNGEAYKNEINSIIPIELRKEKIKKYISELDNILYNEITFNSINYQIEKKKICLNCLPDHWKNKFNINHKLPSKSAITISFSEEIKNINLKKIISYSSDNLTPIELEMIRTIRKSGLFFYKYYINQLNEQYLTLDPLIHYIRSTIWKIKDPNPVFNSAWYLKKYPEVENAKYNPLFHYIKWGAALGYNPHPDFSTNAYMSANKNIIPAGVNPLEHYVFKGALENRPLW